MNLTPQDIKALRNADSICFDMGTGKHFDGPEGDDEQHHYIRAIKRGDRSDTGFEQTHRIEVTGKLTVYNERSDVSSQEHRFDNAFEHISAAQFSPEWVTIASLLRKDDSIMLEWTANNSSDLLRDAGLVADELSLRITRTVGSKVKHLTFLIENSVGKDNSARMIRKGAWNNG